MHFLKLVALVCSGIFVHHILLSFGTLDLSNNVQAQRQVRNIFKIIIAVLRKVEISINFIKLAVSHHLLINYLITILQEVDII